MTTTTTIINRQRGSDSSARSWRLSMVAVMVWFLTINPAAAKPEYLKMLNAAFRPSPSSALAQSKCMTCHLRGFEDETHDMTPFLNRFGRALQGQKTRDVGGLLAIGATDSDGDGWPNILELAQGTLPGDAKSHPPGVAPLTSLSPKTADADRKVPQVLARPLDLPSDHHSDFIEVAIVALLILQCVLMGAIIALLLRRRKGSLYRHKIQNKRRKTDVRSLKKAVPTNRVLNTTVISDVVIEGQQSRDVIFDLNEEEGTKDADMLEVYQTGISNG